MKELVLYIPGKGGSGAESAHYRQLFPDCEVLGLDLRASVPWEAGAELRLAVGTLRQRYGPITLIANSIGAYFSMCAEIDAMLRRAYFISPIVDLEALIARRMALQGVTEEELREKGELPAESGEALSWAYLSWVRQHPVHWAAPTQILYGSRDSLTSPDAVRSFAEKHGCGLTVMEGGEHWFHTEEQMRFLDAWIRKDLTGGE